MMKYAELEIGIHCLVAGWYRVELRFTRPDSEVDERAEPGAVRFDAERLRTFALNDVEYGKLLGQSLFTPAVKSEFEKAAAVASALEAGLRVRLYFGVSAPELHDLRWETLRNPQTGEPFLTNETLPFSRYLSSADGRPARLRPQSELRALALIANPTDIAEYGMTALNVADELRRINAGFGAVPVTALASEGKASLPNLFAHLREEYDILYLVAHGQLEKGEPLLWLERENGKAQRVAGAELVTRIEELAQCPRLIVLVSCQSAGTSAEGALSALGPRLAEAGVPAVIAMQGNISIKTAAEFMPVFFRELQRDGQIDRAMAVARGVVRERPDWWMPALFTRLKSGRIWYNPGFAGDQNDFEHWESLKTFIQEQRCTPILGAGLDEPWLGQATELARRWAWKHNYPFAAHEQEDLPRIAQYLSRREGTKYVQAAFNKAIRAEILRRCGDALPEDLRAAESWKSETILKTLAADAERCWACNTDDSHRRLAALRLPIYITASPADFLALALKKAGANPQIRLCPWWSQRIPENRWRYDDEPTAEKPLVYHLFGHLSVPESLVISEDNYFDFLIGIMRNKDLIPDTVVNALTNSALLFLGFRSNDWGYRVLFRMLMAQEGSAQLREYTHVTAQVEPEEGRVLDTRRAQRYLEKAFHRDNIGIYWGRSEDFLTALARQMRRA